MKTIQSILKALESADCQYASAYGESGYESEKGVILANWNDWDKRIFDLLERAGYGCEWSDEWDICGNGKAWRTKPDSYFWESSVAYLECGDLLTPEDDASEWIEEFASTDWNQPHRILPAWIERTDIEAEGFTLLTEGKETGMHGGQDDDPLGLYKATFEAHPDVEAMLFQVSERSQFYTVWKAFAKFPPTVERVFASIMESDLFRLDGRKIDLCAVLIELCDLIGEETDTDWSLGECLECDLGGLVIGAYWALTEWHAGQASESYAALCAIGRIYSPNMATGPEPDSNEQFAYEQINQYFQEND